MLSVSVVLGASRAAMLACFTFLAVVPGAAQSQGGCSDERYENHNQVDYGPLRLSAVRGVAIDPTRVPMSRACVLLFEERKHALVSKIETASDGSFNLPKVKNGAYRLVVKGYGFCPANVPIVVQLSHKERRRLIVHMQGAGIDSCSGGELE